MMKLWFCETDHKRCVRPPVHAGGPFSRLEERAMANVIILKPGESAPTFGDRALVVRDATSKMCTTTIWRDETVVYQSDGSLLDKALSRAQMNVKRFGGRQSRISKLREAARRR